MPKASADSHYGADPIAGAVAYTSYLKEARRALCQEKAKSHGTMQCIEGNVREGDRVVIVDDVITTGKSTIEAISRSRDAGLEIAGVIALVDRQEGGKENIEALGLDVESVVTRDDVMKLYHSVA